MPFFKTITIVTGVVAGLCALGLPIWLMGLPGVNDDYAKGWKMGLTVIFVYPLLWLANYGPYYIMRNRISAETQLQWQNIAGPLAVVLLLVAIVRMVQAFKTMSR